MFFKIYQTTFKNIYRSAIFWMLFALFGLIAWKIVTRWAYNVYSMELNELIYDTDSRFVLSYRQYVQYMSNATSGNLLRYAMPLFTAITTALVLNRDHGDNFFEIEKAAGVKPSKYVLARLLALFTLNLIVVTILAYFYLHLYVFTRGGVKDLGLCEYIADSTVRMMRMVLFRAIPTIVFYIGFTYCIGSLFKSGIIAALSSIGYILVFSTGYLMLRHRVALIYWDYLSPMPIKLMGYFHYYDHEEFEFALQTYDTSLGKAVLCIGILVGFGGLYSAIAYLRTRVRDR